MFRIILILFMVQSFSFGQSLQIPSVEFSLLKYICCKTTGQLNIDGELNEESWSKAEWTALFTDIEGSTKPQPRLDTRVKMLWDENYFYVAAVLNETNIWGTLTEHDDIIFYDNDFEVFIDPDGDTHNYAELEINALNTVWDLFLIKPYRDIDKAALHGWNIKGLKSGVKIYGTLNNPEDIDSCWTVEIAFPWEAFKEITNTAVPPQNNDQWRVNFSRVEWRTEVKDGKYHKVIDPLTNKVYPEDNWVWSPQGVINMHYPEMWGFVQFSDKEAGSPGVFFIDKKEEKAKWILRQIYYAERNYFVKNGNYTPDITKLELVNNKADGFNAPVIECTSNSFEAYMVSTDRKSKFRINQDGLITFTDDKEIIKSINE
jgi:hypothetical protein